MNCDAYQERIDILLARREDPGADPALQGHLAVCATCEQYLADQKALFGVLTSDSDRAVPTPVRAILYRKLDGTAARRPMVRARRWVLAGALAGAITAVVILMNIPTPTDGLPSIKGWRQPMVAKTQEATADDVAREFFVDTDESATVMATFANYSEGGQ